MTDPTAGTPSIWEVAARRFEATPQSKYLKDPAAWVQDRLGEHLWSKQRHIAQAVVDNRRVAVKSCHNAGKGLPLDTPLPTPTGWTTMGDVQLGDQLIDEAGRPCVVIGATPVWNRPCYRVTFTDGSTVVTDDRHQWSTIRLDERHSLRQRRRQHGTAAPADWREHWDLARTYSTPELAADLRTTTGQLRHAIPLAQPLELPEADLPVAPYVLGAWLGDGTSVSPEITCADSDREIVDRIAALGENVRRRASSPYVWTMAGRLQDRPRLSERLKTLGVIGDKHIPIAYLRASVGQRIELLRGLMDTDGFNTVGGVGMDLMSRRLVNDVAELVRSLGCAVQVRTCKATCNGVDAGIRYRMTWRSSFQPFHLARKRGGWNTQVSSRRSIRTIKSIEPVESVPTRCVEVSSPSSLYLATEHFIPTHNSRIASRLAAWWIDCHPPGEAFVVSTAPTYAQIHAILWEEIRNAAKAAANRGAPLPGRVLGSDIWKLDDGTLVGWGRKPADTDQHGFQGIHRRYVLVLIDEACGVPRQLWTAVEAITTNLDCRIVAFGNPDDPSTEFADVCKPGSGWNVIRISAFDTPNFTDEKIPDELRPLMLDPEWVEDKKRRWGEESPRYVSKVLGDFPDIGEDVLFPPSLIEAAQKRSLEPVGKGVLGVDVARFGSDRTVIYLRRGPVVRLIGEHSKLPTTETTGRVVDAKRVTGADEIRVDGVGVGGGVVDQLTEQGHGVLDMQAGAAPTDRERFTNCRAEWYWALRERFESGDVDIDPADDELAAQLGAMKYRFTPRGQVQIESKDDMRKRGLPSPDRADAVMLTAVTPSGGDLFPKLRWRYWTFDEQHRVCCGARTWPLSEMWVYCTAHLPSGEDAISDWTVAAAWALTFDGDLVLLDRARERVGEASPFEVIRPLVQRYKADTAFVAKRDYAQVLRAGASASGVPVTPLDVDPDPFGRALPASVKQAAGQVWLPADALWRDQWTAEHLAWPNGKYAGCVAALSLAVAAASTLWRPTVQAGLPERARAAVEDPFVESEPITNWMSVDF